MFVINDTDPVDDNKQKEEQLQLMEKIIQEQKKQKTQKVSTKAMKTKETTSKAVLSTKITKKKQVQKGLKDFVPKGVTLNFQTRPTQEQYKQMLVAKDAQAFSLNYKVFLGKILKIIDGDTLKIAFKLHKSLTKFNFRLNGLDTPQSRTGEVKQFGIYVKELTRRMLEGKIVRVQAGQFDKYGRVLSRIYAFSENEEFCVNDFLIQNQLAKSYEGKTKVQFTKEDYQRFKQKFDRTSWPQVSNYPRIYYKDLQKEKNNQQKSLILIQKISN